MQVEAGAARGRPVQPLALGRHPQDPPGRDAGQILIGQPHGQGQPVGAGAVAAGRGLGGAVDADDDIGGVDGRALCAVGQRPGIADQGNRLAVQFSQQIGLGNGQGLQRSFIAQRPGGIKAQLVHGRASRSL